MRYTIEGFRQRVAVDLGLDSCDLIILRWIVDFANTDRILKMQVDNKIFFWIKYDALIEDLPILGLKTKDALYRRLKKMVACGILEHTVVKQGGTFSMYRIGKSYNKLILEDKSDLSDEKSEEVRMKSRTGTDEKSEQNINLLNNKSTKETKKSLPKGKEAKASYIDVFNDEENKYVRDALVKFVNSCKGKNYNPKVSTVNKWASVLREHCGTDSSLAMKTVDHCISEGWKAIYPLKGYNPVTKREKVKDEDLARNEDGSLVTF